MKTKGEGEVKGNRKEGEREVGRQRERGQDGGYNRKPRPAAYRAGTLPETQLV